MSAQGESWHLLTVSGLVIASANPNIGAGWGGR